MSDFRELTATEMTQVEGGFSLWCLVKFLFLGISIFGGSSSDYPSEESHVS